MNRPVNFDKINDLKFDYNGYGYEINLYNNDNISDTIYVYNTKQLNGYCLQFKIDWYYQSIQLSKCIENEGPSGVSLNYNISFNKDEVKTLNAFINSIVRFHLAHHIAIGTFKK
jgi:hypothetical protein